jgi:hypothetical protein
MPKWLHDRLQRSARRLRRRGQLEDEDAYVYGSLARIKERNHGKWPRRPAGLRNLRKGLL